jgi:hypothetical protein
MGVAVDEDVVRGVEHNAHLQLIDDRRRQAAAGGGKSVRAQHCRSSRRTEREPGTAQKMPPSDNRSHDFLPLPGSARQ